MVGNDLAEEHAKEDFGKEQKLPSGYDVVHISSSIPPGTQSPCMILGKYPSVSCFSTCFMATYEKYQLSLHTSMHYCRSWRVL
jgi:hypothetical protein